MQLRTDLIASAAALEAGFARLDERTWQAEVRSALGRTLPASGVPWMRVREVWLHALDLDAGVSTADFPPALVDELLDDVSAVVGAKPDCPSIQLCATDRKKSWALGSDHLRPEVTGTRGRPAGLGQRPLRGRADRARPAPGPAALDLTSTARAAPATRPSGRRTGSPSPR